MTCRLHAKLIRIVGAHQWHSTCAWFITWCYNKKLSVVLSSSASCRELKMYSDAWNNCWQIPCTLGRICTRRSSRMRRPTTVVLHGYDTNSVLFPSLSCVPINYSVMSCYMSIWHRTATCWRSWHGGKVRVLTRRSCCRRCLAAVAMCTWLGTVTVSHPPGDQSIIT